MKKECKIVKLQRRKYSENHGETKHWQPKMKQERWRESKV
jgi:hypothetical protein